MKRFADKVAVVAGGNSGIGLATAKAFAEEGAFVVITGRDEVSLKRAEGEIGPSATLSGRRSRLPEIDRAMGQIGALREGRRARRGRREWPVNPVRGHGRALRRGGRVI